MATQRPALDASFAAFAGQLLAEREVAARAQIIAAEASSRVGAAVVVYRFDEAGDPRWTSRASVGDVKAPAQCEALTLAMVAEQRQPLLFSGDELVREHYAHLDVRRTVAALAYVPLMSGETLLGAIEAVSLDRVLKQSDLAELVAMQDLASRAIAGSLAYEAERNSNFETITRLTSFYDVEKTFHSTLQIAKLLPIICSKARELLPADAVNLWMVQEEPLVLMARDGEDASVRIGAEQDEIIATVAEKGRALVLNDRKNPLLAKRNRTGTVRGVVAVPIVDSGSLVGVLECVNKAEGAFHEDDVFLLSTVADTAAGALHNASLLEAERKIEILETLVEVSQEITSTLNLTRVLQVLVNAPQRIMAYDRAAVALGDRGKLQIRAISGKPEVIQADPAVKALRDTLEWADATEGDLYITTSGGKVVSENQEAKTRFHEYFKATGYRSWYSVPLADEQGQLGILAFESKKGGFLSEAQFELIKVMAAQATVALRNASLYQQVPLIGMLEPILHRKQQFMKVEKKRRLAYAVAAGLALVLLIVVPLPMRVEGHATVAPQRTAQIGVEEDSIVKTVNVREGDVVKAGAVLGTLEDWDYRSALAGAEAKRDQALAQMNQALANNDASAAGARRAEAEYWASEVRRDQERLDHTLLRSPIDGVVATPHLESLVGRKLLAGSTFAEVLDSRRTSIDVAVDQRDLPLVAASQGASVKLEAYPTRKFRGRVSIVSPASGVENDKRVFFARVDVPNEDGLIRSGMEGQAKVSTGWRPAGYVLFRDFGMWGWAKIWSWFGS